MHKGEKSELKITNFIFGKPEIYVYSHVFRAWQAALTNTKEKLTSIDML